MFSGLGIHEMVYNRIVGKHFFYMKFIEEENMNTEGKNSRRNKFSEIYKAFAIQN